MKIIDAFWEKRNLGIDCKEIIIEKTDTIDDIQEIKNLLQPNQYLVVKVPSGLFEANIFLSELGFTFIESILSLNLNVKDAILTPLQKRLNNEINYLEIEPSGLDKLYTEIKNGLFSTDRIILDPKFTADKSALRYLNWIKDELKNESKVFNISYKGTEIGFFILKKINEYTYYPFLSGLYENYTNSGLGFAVVRKPIEEIQKKSGKIVFTNISTNNQQALKTAFQQGFNIINIQNIFIKHLN
jgi:hypothetical protein